MDKVVIELTDQKAYKLLKDMEELHLIRVLKEPIKLSSLFTGADPNPNE